jgi:hypothetical protein
VGSSPLYAKINGVVQVVIFQTCCMGMTEEDITTSCMFMYSEGPGGYVCSMLSSLLTEISYPEQFVKGIEHS